MIFTVIGVPAPQGSKKFVGHAKAKTPGAKYGRAILVEMSKKVKPWRQDVTAAALAARGDAVPMEGPIVVRMLFFLPKPLHAPKNRKTYAMRAPDLSKLIRSTEDAITDAGVWMDDSRVVQTIAEKTYVGETLGIYSALPESFNGRTLIAPGAIVEILRLPQ